MGLDSHPVKMVRTIQTEWNSPNIVLNRRWLEMAHEEEIYKNTHTHTHVNARAYTHTHSKFNYMIEKVMSDITNKNNNNDKNWV